MIFIGSKSKRNTENNEGGDDNNSDDDMGDSEQDYMVRVG